jgi:molybdopterin-guanine dinucleotide biosynthesis protein A
MGYDKKRLKLNGEKVFNRLVTELSSLFGEVLVSSNDSDTADNGIPGVTVLHDEIGEGPLAGIYQGLRRCSSDYLYVTACDMPFINRDYIAYMRELLAQQHDACVARRDDGRYEPFNAFYSVRCAESIQEALLNGEYKISPVLDRLNLCIIDTETLQRFNGETMFFNINRKEDLEAAEKTATHYRD